MEVQENDGSLIRYTHIEKGHTYVILGEVKSKHPDTGIWYDAVIYRQVESRETFVRSKESFINNFKKL